MSLESLLILGTLKMPSMTYAIERARSCIRVDRDHRGTWAVMIKKPCKDLQVAAEGLEWNDALNRSVVEQAVIASHLLGFDPSRDDELREFASSLKGALVKRMPQVIDEFGLVPERKRNRTIKYGRHNG